MDLLTSAQLSEWEAYNKMDPIGGWRGDYRMAFLASMMYNLTVVTHSKKGSVKQKSLTDFMPNWAGEEQAVKTQSVEEMKELLLAFAKRHNKRLPASQRRPPLKKKKNG